MPSECPSRAWDHWYAAHDAPEECVCGKPNADPDTGQWSCDAAPGFCSVECRQSYRIDGALADDGLYAAYLEEAALEATNGHAILAIVGALVVVRRGTASELATWGAA